MIKYIGLLVVGALLGGCAAPPFITALSYMKTGADVVSYATTDKGITDHIISGINDKDCALHRVLFGEEICVEIAEKEKKESNPGYADYDMQRHLAATFDRMDYCNKYYYPGCMEDTNESKRNIN